MSENRRRRPQQPVQPVAAPRKKKKSKSKMKKYLTLLAMMAVVATISIGGTLAWLQDKTVEIENTFTSSDINIKLTETGTDAKNKKNFKMVPGATIEKDPKVTIESGSEPSWVFVKLTKSTDPKFDDYLTYQMAEGWNALEGVDGVYYREQDATTADVTYSVLKNNQVTVLGSVTKDMMEDIMDTPASEGVEAVIAKKPTLTVQAYAIQKANLKKADGVTEASTAKGAWEVLFPTAP